MRIMRPLSQAVCLLKCMNVSINSMCMLHAQIVCPCNHDNQLRDCNRLQKKMAMSWRHSPNDAFPLMNATNQLKMASLSSFKQKLHNRFTLSGKRSFFLASSPSFSSVNHFHWSIFKTKIPILYRSENLMCMMLAIHQIKTTTIQ